MKRRTIRPDDVHRRGRLAAALAFQAVLWGCSAAGSLPASHLAAFGLAQDPRPAAFDVCGSCGCADTVRVSLDGTEWEKVRRLFRPPPPDAQEERARAALAVGLLEELVGPRAGTEHDMPRNEPGPPGASQLDCIAKASNTTVYLLLLERDGLLPRHRVGHPAHRGFLVFFPHNSAVLLEREGGGAWAVDSWYGANGDPAGIWPMGLWRAGREAGDNRENRPPEGERGRASR